MTSQNTDYNGWSNRATWNAALWVDNEYGIYMAKMEERPRTADEVEAFVRGWFPGGETPDGDSLDKVNWREIAEDWSAEYDEAEAHDNK